MSDEQNAAPAAEGQVSGEAQADTNESESEEVEAEESTETTQAEAKVDAAKDNLRFNHSAPTSERLLRSWSKKLGQIQLVMNSKTSSISSEVMLMNTRNSLVFLLSVSNSVSC